MRTERNTPRDRNSQRWQRQMYEIEDSRQDHNTAGTIQSDDRDCVAGKPPRQVLEAHGKGIW
jgi:hypothetical protein